MMSNYLNITLVILVPFKYVLHMLSFVFTFSVLSTALWCFAKIQGSCITFHLLPGVVSFVARQPDCCALVLYTTYSDGLRLFPQHNEQVHKYSQTLETLLFTQDLDPHVLDAFHQFLALRD